MPPRLLPASLLLVSAFATAQSGITSLNDNSSDARENTSDAREGGFVPLFSNSLEGWDYVDTAPENFTLEDGVLRVQGEQGWLRSPQEYGDFVLRLQFRFVTADADSGIFLRAGTGTPFIRGWPGDSYQVQIREISVNTSDSPLPLVNVYRHRVPEGETEYARERVFELYRGVGEWHDLEISALGDSLRVILDGEPVTTATGIVNARGHIGFQSEAGVIEYRDVRIDVR